MRNTVTRGLVFLFGLTASAVVGCSDKAGPGLGFDAGHFDSGPPFDGGNLFDAGHPTDAGTQDGGAIDAPLLDAPVAVDAPGVDAGGTPDAGDVCATASDWYPCNADFGICRTGTCETAPRCSGFLGTLCPGELNCIDDPRDACDPDAGGMDCAGICVPHMCGGIATIMCPMGLGLRCVDDPRDTCDPRTGGRDCSGICVAAAR